MLKKSIAAALLVAIVVWAEIALAPMFLMHAWHAHTAHDMTEPMAAHHHAMPAGHPCCPRIGATENASLPEFVANSLPCQEQHRCCFRQGPQSVPAPVSAQPSQEIAPAETAELSPAPNANSHVPAATAAAFGPPPDLLGMILRV